MFKALDIANMYINLANGLGDHIDNLKLNKMLYYAQGWHLARFGEPLFDDTIEAWEYGPVIPAVYHAYKMCGDNAIAEPINVFDEHALTNDQLSLLTDVYITYGKFTGNELVRRTHRPGSPWSSVFVRGANNEVDKEALRVYFENNNELQEFEVPGTIPVIDYTSRRSDS